MLVDFMFKMETGTTSGSLANTPAPDGFKNATHTHDAPASNQVHGRLVIVLDDNIQTIQIARELLLVIHHFTE